MHLHSEKNTATQTLLLSQCLRTVFSTSLRSCSSFSFFASITFSVDITPHTQNTPLHHHQAKRERGKRWNYYYCVHTESFGERESRGACVLP